MMLDIYSYSDDGGRENNEDSLVVMQRDDEALCVVADGLGGLDSGEVASKMVTQEMKEEYEADSLVFDVVTAIQNANAQVFGKNDDSHANMATTVGTVVVGTYSSIFANVGDTRVYAFKEGNICFQSIDHSASQLAVLAGEITKEEIRTHADRNRLVRVIGAAPKVKVDTKVLENEDFDAFLICSDGFWEYIYEDEMCKLLKKSKDPTEWLNSMRKVVDDRAPRDRDNNTAVVGMFI